MDGLELDGKKARSFYDYRKCPEYPNITSGEHGKTGDSRVDAKVYREGAPGVEMIAHQLMKAQGQFAFT